jgi:DeoR/GlpR family transcriptional regulator of sugar metabolism
MTTAAESVRDHLESMVEKGSAERVDGGRYRLTSLGQDQQLAAAMRAARDQLRAMAHLAHQLVDVTETTNHNPAMTPEELLEMVGIDPGRPVHDKDGEPAELDLPLPRAETRGYL